MHGYTPLLAAAKMGSAECVKLLLEHGASVNCQATVSDASTSATAGAHPPISPHPHTLSGSVTPTFVLCGSCMQNGYTPLIAATYVGSVKCVKLLLAHGADVGAQTTVSDVRLHF